MQIHEKLPSDEQYSTKGIDLLSGQLGVVMRAVLTPLYQRLGTTLVRWPWLCVVPFLIFSPMLFGLSFLSMETRTDRLWSSSASVARFSPLRERYSRVFGSFPSVASVIMAAPPEADILAGYKTCDPFLSEARQLLQEILALQNGSYSSRLCLRPAGPDEPCFFFSPLDYWPTPEACQADRNKHITVMQNFHRHPLGFSLEASTMFGGMHFQGAALANVSALSFNFFLRSSDESESWMRALVDLVSSWGTRDVPRIPRPMRSFEVVAAMTENSISEATMQLIQSQWWLPPLGVGLTIFVMFLALFLSSGLQGLVAGVVSMFILIYSLACTAGLVSFFLPMNPVTLQVAAILVLAVSVDVTFVFCGLSTNEEESFDSLLVQQALVLSGPSLLLAITTIVLTFMCTFISATLAGVSVVITVGVACLMNLILQTSVFFVLLMLLSKARCLKKKRFTSRSWSFGDVYAKVIQAMISKWYFVGFVLLCFACLFAFALVGALKMRQGINISFLAPIGSTEQQFQLATSKYFGTSLSAPWYWMVESNAFNSSAVQQEIQRFKDSLLQSLNLTEISSPLSHLVSWIVFGNHHRDVYAKNRNSIPQDMFVPWLREFLATDGKLHSQDCIFVNDTLVAIRCLSTWSGDSVLDLSMHVLNSLLETRVVNASFESLAWGSVVPMVSQFFDLERNFWIIVGVAVAVVALVTFLFFLNLYIVGVLVTCVCLVLVDLFGFMTLIDVQLNAMTMLTAITGIGLTTEYLLQFLQVFVETGGSVEGSARKVGGSLIVSVLSSSVGMVVLLIFSDSALIRVYFSGLWLGVFIIGALHAFFLAPILLHFAPKGNRSLRCCHRRLPLPDEVLVELKPLDLASSADEEQEEISNAED